MTNIFWVHEHTYLTFLRKSCASCAVGIIFFLFSKKYCFVLAEMTKAVLERRKLTNELQAAGKPVANDLLQRVLALKNEHGEPESIAVLSVRLRRCFCVCLFIWFLLKRGVVRAQRNGNCRVQDRIKLLSVCLWFAKSTSRDFHAVYESRPYTLWFHWTELRGHWYLLQTCDSRKGTIMLSNPFERRSLNLPFLPIFFLRFWKISLSFFCRWDAYGGKYADEYAWIQLSTVW